MGSDPRSGARELSAPLEDLYQVATAQLDCARATFSGFRVGAALLSDGHIFPGCNVENSSYGLTLCAERSAVMHWASAGSPGTPEAIVVVARNSAGDTVTAMPCGACRQRIREFGADNTSVMVCSPDGLQRVFTLGELLPESFGPENLD